MDESLSVFEISGSGLAAQRLRMGVIAANIANANSTSSPDGGPYRRRDVIFETVLRETMDGAPAGGVAGVKVAKVAVDQSPPKRTYDPENPLADKDGFVNMPNVEVVTEMVNLTTAERGYNANLNAIKAYRDMLRSAVGIIRQ